MVDFDRLVSEYVAEIREDLDWEQIVQEARSNTYVRDDGETEGAVWLGTISAIFPDNETLDDDAGVTVHGLYWEALEYVAEQFGGSVGSGDYDPCDIYFWIVVDEE